MIVLGLLKLIILILIIGLAIGLLAVWGFVHSINATRKKFIDKAKQANTTGNDEPQSTVNAGNKQRQHANGRKIIADDEGEYVDFEEVE